MNPKPPKGLIGVVITNSVFALVCLAGLVVLEKAGGMVPAAAFGMLIWACLGPGLLIRRRFTWRVGRTLIYAFAMGLSLVIMFSIFHGSLFNNPVVVLWEVLVVVYLIGVRGYLNTRPALEYYRIYPPGA